MLARLAAGHSSYCVRYDERGSLPPLRGKALRADRPAGDGGLIHEFLPPTLILPPQGGGGDEAR